MPSASATHRVQEPQQIIPADKGPELKNTLRGTKAQNDSSGDVSGKASGDGALNDLPKSKPHQSNAFADLAQTKVRNAVKDEDGNLLRISISKSASEKLRFIKESDKNPDLILRISVESGGCHGFQYIFSLKNKDNIDIEEDGVFERNGATVVLDSTSLEVLRDATIDYTTELIGSQFKVTSPYTDSTCGCGSSFSFDPSKIHAKA